MHRTIMLELVSMYDIQFSKLHMAYLGFYFQRWELLKLDEINKKQTKPDQIRDVGGGSTGKRIQTNASYNERF